MLFRSVGAKGVVVPAQNYAHDLNAMLQAISAKTKIIFITNPNNPTGTLIDKNMLRNFLV